MTKWKLVQRLVDGEGKPDIDAWDEDGEDLSVGYTLLRALAEEDHTLVEIAPGVWRHSAEGVTYEPKGGGPFWG